MYPLYLKMKAKMGGKLATAVFTLSGLALVLVPAWMFAGSMFESATSFYQSVESGSFDIPPPNESVREWPLVGQKIFEAWSTAASNFEAFLEQYASQLKGMASFAIGKVTGIGLTVLAFVFATLIAAVMLSNADAVAASMRRFHRRLLGERGDAMMDLTVATIRSVTVGVLGIAVIQAIGTGLGMFVVGVPGTGIWALLVLVLVIAQLPALLVMLPVIFYVASVESGTVTAIFAIWSIGVSMSDVVLKPLLLGRGVEAPMLVILLGAIGGMVMSGIIGLFVGAVVLAVGYKLFQVWLEMGETDQAAANPTAEAAAEATE